MGQILFSSNRFNFYKLSDQYFEEFCEMDLDPDVMEFYTSRPHGTREYAWANFTRYIDYMNDHPLLGGFVAFNKETKEFAGLGVLIHLELNAQNTDYEVGYRLPKRSWGKGYATEICKTLLSYGFNELGFKEIYGTTHPKHVVSQKVLEKSGLKKIGSSQSYGGSTVFKIEKKVLRNINEIEDELEKLQQMYIEEEDEFEQIKIVSKFTFLLQEATEIDKIERLAANVTINNWTRNLD